MANLHRILMLETPNPQAVRREVSFCEAVHDGHKGVEGVKAVLAKSTDGIHNCWENDDIAVVVDPRWQSLEELNANVSVDAILAKNQYERGRFSDRIGPGIFSR
jgi:xanthine dehydrogenase accessory factor